MAALIAEMDPGLLPGTHRHRGGEALLFRIFPRAPGLLALGQSHQAHGEDIRPQDLVEIHFEPPIVPGSHLVAERVLVALGQRALGAGIDGAAGRADPKEHGVGSAGLLESARVVGVDRNIAVEEIHHAGRVETTGLEDKVLSTGIGTAVLRAAVIRRSVGEVGLDRGPVRQYFRETIGSEVLEKLRREHLHGGRGIHQASVQPTARGRVPALVADVLAGIDEKGREFDGGFRRDRRREGLLPKAWTGQQD